MTKPIQDQGDDDAIKVTLAAGEMVVEVDPEGRSIVSDHHCSFCGKERRQVRKLVANSNANHRVCICNECVDLCNQIMSED